MSISVSGQNERWAQLNAYQPPPTSQPGQNGGWESAIQTSVASGQTGTATSSGGAPAGLSDGMSLVLMALGGWGNGSGSTQTTGVSSGASNASSSSSAPAGQAGITLDGTASVSQLVTDLQSLLSALTGTPASTSSPGTPSTGATSDPSGNTGATAATALSSTVLQDLQTVGADLDSLASTSGAVQPNRPERPPPGSPPPGSNDISTTGTVSVAAGGDITDTGTASDSQSGGGAWQAFMQQFAFSAYTAGGARQHDHVVAGKHQRVAARDGAFRLAGRRFGP